MIAAAISRGDVADYVQAVFFVYLILLFAYLLLNLVFSFGATPPYARWSDALLQFLREVSEPYLRIFRRIMPSMGAIDLSPMLAIIVLYVLETIITRLIRG